MSIADTKAQLQQAIEEGENATSLTHEVKDKAENAAQAVTSATADSSVNRPEEAVGLYRQALDRAEEAQAALAAANDAVREYMTTI
ncbi:hypothetical protein [Salininema proteolyticum]|uniref:Uncharacterized protein n=1 Tax=Salininema proteolyticum TaxID=1607685 RepID=A0ABV8TSU5_9ACTN